MRIVDDTEEFKSKIEARYTLKELMEYTGLSRSWIQRLFDQKGTIAAGKVGKEKVYNGFALDELLKSKTRRKGTKKSKTSETPQASKTSQEYEELIPQLQADVKTLQSQMLKMANKLNEVLESQKP